MTEKKFDVDKLRVASPCSIGWERMTGDDRRRFCNLCNLNVYNISEMTSEEVRALIGKSEGRVCGRLYKRADGTVLTKDCPVGWGAYQKRAARFAGAALATVLGLFSISFGQKEDQNAVDASKLNIVRTAGAENKLKGTIVDPNGAIVSGAEILIRKGKIKIDKIVSDAEGKYISPALAEGNYSIEVSYPGFKIYRVKNIEIRNNEIGQLDIILQVNEESITVGVIAEPSAIDITSSSVQTTITREMMDRIPHEE